jgi:hypothetical protein
MDRACNTHGKMINLCKILGGKPEGKNLSENLVEDGG